ncbi:transposase [Thermodesulfobacteriota bacterium]
MAKYKKYSYDQARFIPIHFDKQILPGTFEYTLSYLIDNEIDLSLFDNRYSNDEIGAPAYDPSILLKIVLYAYSRGIVSSRKIARCCQENIIFMALSADTRPHFTTIADFVPLHSLEAFDGILHPSMANMSLPMSFILSQIKRTSLKSPNTSFSIAETKSAMVVKCGRVSADNAMKMIFSWQQRAILRLETIPRE